MKKLFVGLVTAAALLMPTSVAVAGDTTVSDWDGVWTSIDGVDGSNQLLLITARRGTLRFTIFDASGSVCGGIPVLGRGRAPVADIADDQVTIIYRVRCADGRPAFDSIPIVYDLADGVLTDTVDDGETITITPWRHLFG